MSKSLLTAKVVGGGVLGTGAVVAGGYGIVEHFKSKETTETDQTTVNRDTRETTTPAQGTPSVPEAGDSQNLQPQPGSEANLRSSSVTPSGSENQNNSQQGNSQTSDPTTPKEPSSTDSETTQSVVTHGQNSQ